MSELGSPVTCTDVVFEAPGNGTSELMVKMPNPQLGHTFDPNHRNVLELPPGCKCF